MNNKVLIQLLMFPVLFLFLLIDGQLSTLATNWSVGAFAISSHLVFMLAMFYAQYMSFWKSIFIFFLLGIVYDSLYLGLLGMATTLFPLALFFIYFFFQGIERKKNITILILLVVIFGFEGIGYLFASTFQITSLPLFSFVFYKLLPTLLFNIFLFIIIQPLLQYIFRITNKT